MSDPPRRVGDAGAVRPPESTYLDEFLPLNPLFLGVTKG